jgi:type I restriction enzyme R subunit
MRSLSVGHPERATQIRIIALFHDELCYRYLGDWTYPDGNCNIEEGVLTPYLPSGHWPSSVLLAPDRD